MRFTRVSALAAVAAAIAVPATAQVVTVGSTKGGVLAAVATGTAKVISQHAGVQMRTEKLGGTQQYIPVVDAGEIDFGISNVVQYKMALSGTGLSKRKHRNLRLVSRMMTFRTGPIVPGDSKIKELKDVKGMRVPYGFKAAPLFQMIFTSYLTNAGLTWDDVKKVPIVGLRQNWDAFKQGKIDISIGNAGSGINKELNSVLSGGIRHVTLYNKGANAEKILKDIDGMFYMRVDPNPKFITVKGPVYQMAYPFVLWTHKGVKDEIAYKVTKTMYEKEAELKSLSPVWGNYFAKNMNDVDAGEFHPGAVKFYQEVGIWKK